MNTRECKAIEMGKDDRQEDVHELLSRLIDHLTVELTFIAETFNLTAIFDIHLRSTITCQRCLHSKHKTEYLSLLSLHFPLSFNQQPSDSVVHVLHI